MGNAKNQQLWQMDMSDSGDMPMGIDPGTTYFEDSSVYWNPAFQGTDGVTGKVLPCRNDTNGASQVGFLRDLNPVNIYGTNQTPNQPSSYVRVSRRGLFLLYVTAGENYQPFAALHQGADEQTVSTSGTNIIAYVSPEQAIVTNAVAGTQILAWIVPPYPTTAI